MVGVQSDLLTRTEVQHHLQSRGLLTNLVVRSLHSHMGRSLPQFFLVQRQPQFPQDQLEDLVSLTEHPQAGDAVLLSRSI